MKSFKQIRISEDKNFKVLNIIKDSLGNIGWKVHTIYISKSGSAYMTIISDDKYEYITKIRISDHEEVSDKHSIADIQILVDGAEIDYESILNAIKNGESGLF